jgi:hypothetical protein
MASNDAELIRKMINVVEKTKDIQSTALMEGQEVEEAFPVLKQAVQSKLLGLAGKFSRRMEGQNQAKKALVPYLKMFVTQMGRKNQDWDTVTWRTVLNYMISNASLRLPLGEFEPQQLKSQDITNIIADDLARKRIQKYMGSQGPLLNSLMPKNISSKMNMPVAGNQGKAAAQNLITGLFMEAIQVMFDKAQESPEYKGPAQPQAAPAAAPVPAQPSTTPAAPTSGGAPTSAAGAGGAPAGTPALTAAEITTIKQLLGL